MSAEAKERYRPKTFVRDTPAGTVMDLAGIASVEFLKDGKIKVTMPEAARATFSCRGSQPVG